MAGKGIFRFIAITGIVTIVAIFLTLAPCANAQTWQAIPPYNFLWPLWSPALSPVDPDTGLKAPLVTTLTSSTILPLQPGLLWNPIYTNPYFIYNSPLGLQYYDLVYGMNPWPPSYSIDPVSGAVIPLTLPAGYQYLPPTDITWLQDNVPLANQAYLAQYPSWALAAYASTLPANLAGLDPLIASLIYPTPASSSLLTSAQLLGYAPVTSAQYYVPPVSTIPPSTTVVPIPPVYPSYITVLNPAAAILALGLLGLL